MTTIRTRDLEPNEKTPAQDLKETQNIILYVSLANN